MLDRLANTFRTPGKAIALLVALLAAMLPLATRAQAPAGPPAVRFSFDFQLQSSDTTFSLHGEGVANQTGELQAHLEITDSGGAHSLDEFVTGGVVYLSQDGGPYQSMSLAELTGQGVVGSALPRSTSPPGGCGSSSAGGFGGFGSLFGPGSPLVASGALRQTGDETLNGTPVQHLSLHGDLATVLTGLVPAALKALEACGLPASMFDPSQIQMALADPQTQAALSGATLDLDVFLSRPDNFPRRIRLDLNVPAAPFRLTTQEDLTPLQAPAPITPPR